MNDPLSLNMVSTQRTGFIAIPEVRWYPGASACEGFYLALAGRYRTSQTLDEDDNVRLDRSAVGGALLLGFQRLSDGYAVDFFSDRSTKRWTRQAIWTSAASSTTTTTLGCASG